MTAPRIPPAVVLTVALAGVLGVVAGTTGCAGHSSRHAARVLPPAQWRTAVALDAIVFEHGRQYAVYPAPELSIRRGVGGGWDVGGKLGAGNLEASARRRWIDRPELAVALVPGLRFDFALATNNSSDLFRTALFNQLVLERVLSRRLSLLGTVTAAVAVADSGTLFAGSTHTTRVLAEPALGVAVRMLVGRRVLWPELTVTFPYAPGDSWQPPLVQVGVALEL